MNTLVIDLETKKSFDEVGGRNNLTALGVSVAGVFSYATKEFHAYEEYELSELEDALKTADLVIGFNIKNFDWPVLQPYLKTVRTTLVPTLDIFEDVTQRLGHRISLNSLASATLGAKKSSDGLQALRWYKEGKIKEIKEYCLKDVEITRDIYEYGKKHGHLYFDSLYDSQRKAVAVSWQKSQPASIMSVLQEAFKKRQRLAIEYVSRTASANEEFKKMRKIDIYALSGLEVSAYCHLRQGLRSFKLESIVACHPLDEYYTAPQDLQSSLF
ncbi:MAG: hypothetical protein A3I44_04880 [Candidatus Sungbacteria bacterium RIFCSPLOWO2_02_FULL_51_17]|nr:MAG: hypothetical protein A2676_00100 [Candidatus Sungbacteria bacterium RIFCSPHIGHO2_01_FULL_51_22]OHA06876.1 MAG: hypothetical protein A3B29_01665 [Candidatus Sungbacteria bacterium RIFCSPLOWO2_01_FULL_51_34]OHA11364.1 MAG: hypothetical protein A3I44_04880 [Candidatus Sungbacteria bacterium RIFCSPLOWO2_02_FULL_51_17]